MFFELLKAVKSLPASKDVEQLCSILQFREHQCDLTMADIGMNTPNLKLCESSRLVDMCEWYGVAIEECDKSQILSISIFLITLMGILMYF